MKESITFTVLTWLFVSAIFGVVGHEIIYQYPEIKRTPLWDHELVQGISEKHVAEKYGIENVRLYDTESSLDVHAPTVIHNYLLLPK